jgi:ABC-type transport system involved in multi-copper enzyme maturation permease subunit
MIKLSSLRYENPVLAKELRSRMRGGRAYWVTFLYLALLASLFVGFYAYWSYGDPAGTAAELGRNLFGVSSTVQLVLVAIIVPALTAGMITLEKEQKTYELLAATGLSARNIVCGKLLSALLFVVLLALTSLPFTSVSFFFGGVSPLEILAIFSLLLSVAFGAASIGILFSSFMRHTAASFAVTYVVYLGLGSVLLGGISASVAIGGASGRTGAIVGLLYGGGSTYGVTIPAWVYLCAYIIVLGILLIIIAVERMEHFHEDKSLAKRLVSSVLYLYSLALIFAVTLGSMGGASAIEARFALAGFLTTLFAIVVLVAPLFVTGELTEPWPRGLISYLATGFNPRNWLRGTLRGGMPFLLLWVVAGGALLRYSFVWSGVRVPARSWALFWADLELLGAVLFGLWGLGVFLSAALNGRSQALGVTYFACAMLVVLPLLPLIWVDNLSVRPLYNLLYLNPFFALWTQSESNSMRIAESLRFAPIAPWVITAAVYLVIGTAGLAFASPIAAHKMPRPEEKQPEPQQASP